jgi:CheY-like chemotaxis protein
VIFLTGDTLSQEISEFLGKTRVPAVSKPFNQEELRRAVHRVLA